MKKLSIPVLLVSGVLIVALQAAERLGWLPDLLHPAPVGDDVGPPEDVLCGPKSLHTAMNLLGVPIEPGSIIQGCKIEAQGVSFGELTGFAKRSGLAVALKRLQWDELVASETASVLYVAPAHYVTVDTRQPRGPKGTVRYYDPNHVARWIDRENLERVWKGDTLLLKAQAAPREVEFETCWLDLGFVSSDVQDFEVRVRNRGMQPRKVTVAGTSCNCTTASLTSELLEPHGEAVLRATVSLKDRRGVFQERVQVSVEGYDSPWEIWLCGGRYADALCRSHEFLGELRAGEEFKKVDLHSRPG